MREIVLAGACRTPIGKLGGALANVRAKELGALAVQAALSRAGVPPEAVDEVLLGCVLQAAQGQNIARQIALAAGIPVETPAMTLNNVCGSGLRAVTLAASLIAAGEAEVIVAGGAESMSNAPYALTKARFGYRMNDGQLVDTMIRDGLWESVHDYHMGVTAENVAARCGITREMQDAFAAESQQRCARAQSEGRFAQELVPVPVKQKKETVWITADEAPRPGVTAESIARLAPAFMENGTVTAANASGINDGAAAVIVLSAEKAKALGVKPMARFVSGAWAGVAPELMGLGPIPATRKALEKAGLTVAALDRIEANEAFAAQCLAVQRELELPADRMNVNGGAIALGHPIGASGCRILVTLLHELARAGGRYGLATLCVGGGMGVSAVVERA